MGTCVFFFDVFMPTPRPVRGMVDVVSTLPVFLRTRGDVQSRSGSSLRSRCWNYPGGRDARAQGQRVRAHCSGPRERLGDSL